MNDVLETIDARALAVLAASAAPPFVLDVREGWERDIAALAGTVHIPMGDIPQRYAELPLDRHIVVMCHHGGRSANVTAWLRRKGFHATNLEGGIDAWTTEVDPSLARY